MQYLLGIFILGIVWLFFFLLRRDLRHITIWSGIYYLVVLTIGFIAIKILDSGITLQNTIIPGYWNPNTLFNLGRITGGYSIEDALYIFFTAGIAGAIYEAIFRKHLGHKHLWHEAHLALIVGGIAGLLVILLRVNLIYTLIAFGFAGALTIWIQRKDLIAHSLIGGLSYLIVYTSIFVIFLQFSPHFVQQNYNLSNISGILILGIPLEELLFAFSFGLMWSPIYEYVKDIG